MSIDAAFLGRWDLTIHHVNGDFPSWFELNENGTGQFVGQFGNARPIQSASSEDGVLTFSLPKQYEQRTDDMTFIGSVEGGQLRGTTTDGDGSGLRWTGVMAPLLPGRDHAWGPANSLIGPDLSNWEPRSPNSESNWSIEGGMLVNSKVGSDLILTEAHDDFRLVAEYRYPAGSNSGIYLRGRYEVQIVDDFGKEPSWGSSGAIYGFLVPSSHAIYEADQWNRIEIELVGRWVSIDLNGVRIIDRKEIPGITGGALESDEAAPGRLFLQGDHGPITFRRLDISLPNA